MNLMLEPEIRELAAVFDRALAAEGERLALARRAEEQAEPVHRGLTDLLSGLGVPDLDVRTSASTMAGGVELCRTAGRHLLPYPLPETLAAHGHASEGIVLVDDRQPHLPHGRALEHWAAVTMDGALHDVTSVSAPLGGLVSPFTSPALVRVSKGVDPVLPVVWLTLDGAYLVGGLETAMRLSIEHLADRFQFGRPLKDFQSLRFRAADMAVTVSGLVELAYYAAWSVAERPTSALTDAMALRMAVLDAARDVLQSAHQIHGAIGFTDEHDLSVVTRHLQGRLRTPWDLEETVDRLANCVDEHGFDGLFTGTGALG